MSEPSGDVFGKRYGEVLLIRLGQAGPEATVYNTFPLNDCPAQQWNALDAEAIAKENGVAAALLNGPRYWLMSRIGKKATAPQPRKSFGGIDMIEQATVQLASNNPAPYSVNKVDRRAVFTFDAGRPVFELVDPDGKRWVMQTWSQVVDKNLDLADLAGLASRLNPPTGWRYETRTLTEPLTVDTTDAVAHVMQDELTNSYSLQSG
jgi:hypothetical protein